jgi:hypothetical protein
VSRYIILERCKLQEDSFSINSLFSKLLSVRYIILGNFDLQENILSNSSLFIKLLSVNLLVFNGVCLVILTLYFQTPFKDIVLETFMPVSKQMSSEEKN